MELALLSLYTDPAVCPSEDLEEFVESREHGIGTAQSVLLPQHLLESDDTVFVNRSFGTKPSPEGMYVP